MTGEWDSAEDANTDAEPAHDVGAAAVVPPPDPVGLVAEVLLRRCLTEADIRARAATSGCITLVEAADASWLPPLARAWLEEVWGAHRYASWNGGTTEPSRRPAHGEPRRVAPCVAVIANRQARQAGEEFEAVRQALARGHAVVVFTDALARFPVALRDAADLRLSVPAPNGAALTEAAEIQAGAAATEPFQDDLARHIVASDLWLAFRPEQDADGWLARLKVLAERRAAASSVADAPTLEMLGGMDEAVALGRAIVRDLADYAAGRIPWSQVAPGLLLHGAPGTGKTLFARALARSAGVPLLTGSLAEWQAANDAHLGDLLKAMRRRFAEARQAAPCILFIDEIDGFGDRSSFSRYHRDYSTQVVNGLLEELDGVTGRAGVVVVAACNDPDRLDPAIRRSGRLDRSVEIPLPDAKGLVSIARHHLDAELADADLSQVVLPLVGATGADVARLVRDARRRARQAGRPLRVDDLLAEIGGAGQDNRPATYRRVLAVHEAGHALVGALHEPEALVMVTLRPEGRAAARTRWQPGASTALTRAQLDIALQRLLAGRAAEEVLLGEVSAGAGGTAFSDLGEATLLAVSAATALGLEGSLLWTGLPKPEDLPTLLPLRPRLASWVSARLDEAYAAARQLIEQHRPTVEHLVELLLERGTLSGAEVLAVVEASGARSPATTRASASPETATSGASHLLLSGMAGVSGCGTEAP